MYCQGSFSAAGDQAAWIIAVAPDAANTGHAGAIALYDVGKGLHVMYFNAQYSLNVMKE